VAQSKPQHDISFSILFVFNRLLYLFRANLLYFVEIFGSKHFKLIFKTRGSMEAYM
jgi:hypothetical protein